MNPVEDALASGDVEHQQSAAASAGEDTNKAMSVIATALNLTAFIVEANPMPWDKSFPNDVAAMAGIARAVRSIRAAVHLVWTGYPEEAAALLRLSYEAAGLARVLAKDPTGAHDWLIHEHAWPDSRVRKWIREQRGKGATTEMHDSYALLSAFAHPSPRSCLSQLDLMDAGPRVRLRTVFDRGSFHSQLWHVAASAMFAMFCARNAAAGHNGESLPTWWHEAAARVTEAHVEWANLPESLEHVRRQAEEHGRRWGRLNDALSSVDGLDGLLDADTMSWRNLQRQFPPDDA